MLVVLLMLIVLIVALLAFLWGADSVEAASSLLAPPKRDNVPTYILFGMAAVVILIVFILQRG